MKKYLIIVLAICTLWLAPQFPYTDDYGETNVRGKVLHVLSPLPGDNEWQEQEIIVRILDGEFSGETRTVINTITGNPRYDMQIETADIIILSLNVSENKLKEAHIAEYGRHRYLSALGLLFILFLIILGQRKGIHSLAALGITILIIVRLLIPLLLQGYNPMLITTSLACIIAGATLLIISGWNRKSLAAFTGIVGGLILAGTLAYIFGSLTRLTGYGLQDAPLLRALGGTLNLKGILYSSMILGALGAIMDVAVSVASSQEQVHLARYDIDFKYLFKAGIAVGGDIMGTMINTLILAYTGGALPFLMLIMSQRPALLKIINQDFVSTEIIRALTGSIGLIFAIPLTALVAALLYSSPKQ